MATNPALKTVAEFSADPAEHELNRRVVQFERNAAEKTKETDHAIAQLQATSAAGYLEQDFLKTSDTVLTAVPGLSFPAKAGEKWVVAWSLYLTTTTAGGIKVAVAAPSGAEVKIWGSTSASSGVNDVIGTVTGNGAALSIGPAAGTTAITVLSATIVNGPADGDVVLQVAQNASNGTPLVVTEMSHFRAQRVG